MFNLVEMCAEQDEQYQSPCKNGNIVDRHACYCHCEDERAPRKCPIWRHYGESDLSKWHGEGDFDSDDWNGGCKWFEKTPNAKAVGLDAARRAVPSTDGLGGADLRRKT